MNFNVAKRKIEAIRDLPAQIRDGHVRARPTASHPVPSRAAPRRTVVAHQRHIERAGSVQIAGRDLNLRPSGYEEQFAHFCAVTQHIEITHNSTE